jgi:hypothetical protein
MDLSFISDIELSFTTSFKHTSRVKYNVDFSSSNIVEIINNLKILKERIRKGEFNDKNVGYDFSINDVQHILNLIDKAISVYSKEFSIDNPPNQKLNLLLNQLRINHNTNPKDISIEVIKEIMAPKLTNDPKNKKTIKEIEIQKKSIERALKNSKKLNK